MRLLISLSAFACLLAFWPAHAALDDTLAVIVPQNHGGGIVEPTELSLIFWRKKLYWKDGKRIQPVNLASENPLRRLFSREVLGSLPENQTEYWNIQYYHGISPPHVVNSQEAMLRYVAETPGAIGYVSACVADSRVKAIAWVNESGVSTTRPADIDCSRR
jgi:ABC-type phosphate transport system substrate-binding protein